MRIPADNNVVICEYHLNVPPSGGHVAGSRKPHPQTRHVAGSAGEVLLDGRSLPRAARELTQQVHNFIKPITNFSIRSFALGKQNSVCDRVHSPR